MTPSDETLLQTPLHDLHVELGAKMVPFAGYDMPVQYPMGVLSEHLFTRANTGLFDVSHMGQAFLRGVGDAYVAVVLEALVPGNLQILKPGGMRYTMLLNTEGGILDDLMVTRYAGAENTLYIVVNAACKDADFALIEGALQGKAELERLSDRALMALQGPKAAEVLGGLAPGAADMAFMTGADMDVAGISCHVSRSGYTGEDGYEISVSNAQADALARKLLSSEHVEAIGLGARDSLRLEAGLCLYGSDIDETTSPADAGLMWAIGKTRREARDFPGAENIMRAFEDGPARRRVGILPEGRAPARHGVEVVDEDGNRIGEITSGGFGPTLGGPVAMGYVDAGFAEVGTQVGLVVRGKTLPATVAAMPFVEQRYFRKPK